MTTQASIPAKWFVPFANGDVNRVEIPVTTSDPTRASQTLGFPPLTMQPPESGGVPPQGEDFNGGMNQVARVAWWVLNGGGWPFDAAFAANANINGYPNGATLQAADFRGEWISLADGNTNNPDTGSGTAWVPGFQYGVTALSSLTGGTVTPTPAQAAKGSITLAGTLTSALTVVLPTWLKNWTITNNTTGAFVTIVKTTAGSGVTIPQNGAPTRVTGDGTNIVQSPENIAAATSGTHGAQLATVQGLITNMQVFAVSGTFTVPANVTKVKYRAIAGGGGAGGSTIAKSSAGGAGAGGYSEGILSVTPAQALTVTVGAPGAQGTTGAGGIGGTTSITGTNISVSCAGGGASGAVTTTNTVGASGAGATSTVSGSAVLTSFSSMGAPGQIGSCDGTGGNYFGGNGAPSPFGGSLGGNGGYPGGATGAYGAGGSGGANNNFGGNGSPGVVIFEW